MQERVFERGRSVLQGCKEHHRGVIESLAMTEILLIEDQDADAELTARTLAKGGVTSRLIRAHDGAEKP